MAWEVQVIRAGSLHDLEKRLDGRRFLQYIGDWGGMTPSMVAGLVGEKLRDLNLDAKNMFNPGSYTKGPDVSTVYVADAERGGFDLVRAVIRPMVIGSQGEMWIRKKEPSVNCVITEPFRIDGRNVILDEETVEVLKSERFGDEYIHSIFAGSRIVGNCVWATINALDRDTDQKRLREKAILAANAPGLEGAVILHGGRNPYVAYKERTPVRTTKRKSDDKVTVVEMHKYICFIYQQ